MCVLVRVCVRRERELYVMQIRFCTFEMCVGVGLTG